MDWNLITIPAVSLGRAIFGWLENSLVDKKIDLPEWQQLGATIVRMGVPMVALIYGLNVPTEIAAGIAVLFDVVIVKLYNALKKK